MKHNLFSRFISVLLAVVMLAGLMSMPSLADTVTGTDTAATDNVNITEDDTEATTAPAALSEEGTEEEQTAAGEESGEPVDVDQENNVSEEGNASSEDENASSDVNTSTEEENVPADNGEATGAEDEAASSEEEKTTPVAVQLTAEAKDEDGAVVATVTAEADEGVIPEGATLVAELLTGEDAEAAAAELDKAEVDYDGYMALDIHLEDADGNEVEPKGEVRVVMVAPAALPEDADPTTVAVQHHEEQDDGSVNVEEVASAADTAATPAALSAEDTSAEQPTGVATEDTDVTAAFMVEEFSNFTVTWKYEGWFDEYETSLNFECKTTDEMSLPTGLVPAIADDTLQSGKTINFTRYNSDLAIAGYTFEHAELNDKKVDSITAQYHWASRYWTYNDQRYRQEPTVTLYYTKNDDSGDSGDSDTGNGKTITFKYYRQSDLVGSNPNYDKAPKDTVKFTVNLLDENGNLTDITPDSIGWNGDTRTFDQDTVTVKELISTIAVDNYTLEDGYAFFFWNGNIDSLSGIDLVEALAHPVIDFKNFSVRSNYGDKSQYLGQVTGEQTYDTIGYRIENFDGTSNDGYDWSETSVANSAQGYYAYEYGGVLHIVLKPITEDVSYKTFFYNYAESGEHIVDTTQAHDMNYSGNQWTGKLTMTEMSGTDLASPGAGYTFVGWYDSQDATGNGTGKKIVGEEELTSDKTVYARWEYTASKDELVITKLFVDADGESIDPPADLDHIVVTGNAIWGNETTPFTVTLRKDENTGDFKGSLNSAYFYKDYQVTGETMYDEAGNELADSSKWSRDSFTLDRKYDDVDLTINDPVTSQASKVFNITAAKLLLVRGDGNTGYVTMIQLPSKEEQEAITKKLLTIHGLSKVEWLTLDQMLTNGVKITYNDDGTVTLNFSDKSDWNKFYTGDFDLIGQTMTGSLVNKRTDEDEYPVRFYLEGVQNNSATNIEFEDKWAVLDSVYTGGFVALPDANTCVYSSDLVKNNGHHVAADVITGDAAVRNWLNTNNANPKNLSVDSVSSALQTLVDAKRLTTDATLVSVGNTTYTVGDVLESPQDFELVYTQVAENTDVIQKYKRGNRLSNGQQQSYHVHLTVKYKPGTLVVTKAFDGVEDLPDSFKIEVKDGNTVVDTLTKANGNCDESTKKYTWTLDDMNGVQYTLVESGAGVTDMDLTTDFVVTETGKEPVQTKGSSTATAQVNKGEITTVDVNNKYTPSNGDLMITKSITGLDPEDIEALKENLTFTWTNKDGSTTNNGSVKLKNMVFNNENGQYEYTVRDLPANAEYTVTESGYNVADYDRDTINPTSSDTTIRSGSTVTVGFTNKYTWNPKGSLTINKTLTSFNNSMGDDATFQFKIEALSGKYTGRVWYEYMTFSTAGDDSKTLSNLPEGQYQVTELDSAGYKLSAGVEQVQSDTITASKQTVTMTYTNESTGGNTPGDQDIVRNNFTYDSTAGVWKFTQEHN